MRNAAETTMSRPLLQVAAALLYATITLAPGRTLALSDLSPAPRAEQAQQKDGTEAIEGPSLPSPDPAIAPPAEGATPPASPGAEGNTAAEDGRPLEIIRDMSTLPAPVKAMRERILEAAASGDIERLRPLFDAGDDQAQVMNGETDDPIETMKSFSGDPEGQEILAILLDVLSTGAARFDAGTPDEAYVWPYFTGKPISSLTPPERVELLRIVTSGDLAGMEENGNYNFFRIGISPAGKVKFFSGGD